MEFWGVEVKSGQSLSVKPEDLKYLHLSQATLGESKKGKENVPVTIFLKIDDQKLVLGILSADHFPQLSFDLVFEEEFVLSHNGKGASIYCFGYHSPIDDQEQVVSFPLILILTLEDEELALQHAPNGKPCQKEKCTVVKKCYLKSEAAEKSDVKFDEDDESDEDEDSDDESDVEMIGADSDFDDEEKKRPNEPASNTPVSKKSKLGSGEKSDVKKGGRTTTPLPAKKPVKAPVSPKSCGKFSCKSCDKSFGSEVGLQSHSKAKHGG